MKKQKQQEYEINKILSTSITLSQNIHPVWVSDVVLNYMSAYDFVSYDIDDQTFSVLERPPSNNTIISAKYSQLIGQHAMRVVYLMKSQTQYHLQVLPAINFKDKITVKKIVHSKIKVDIQKITKFIYLSENHRVLIQVQYSYPAWPPYGLISMSLVNNTCSLYSSEDKIEAIEQIKNMNIFVIIYKNKLQLIKMQVDLQGQLKLLREQPFQKSFSHSICINFTKSYICLFENNESKLYLYHVEEQNLRYLDSYQVPDLPIGGLIGNKLDIILWSTKQPILLLYRMNENQNVLYFKNKINLSPTIQRIKFVSVSESIRNCFIANANSEGQITQSYIFKLQMATQLKMHDCSIYLKPMKYINKMKKIKQLAIPKIFNNIYSLSGSHIHSLQRQNISGVLCFDIHPLGFFMAVSYSFNIKIYSIETQSMTLLYSFSMHNIKKLLYTADGSSLVLFSSKKIRVLDSYSFEQKFEYKQKNNIIIDILYGENRFMVYILLDNATIMERNLINFQKQNVIRLFSQGSRKIQSIKIYERTMTIFALIDDGSLIIKKADQIMGFQTKSNYQDNQKITCIEVDERNSMVFLGTQSGLIRIHRISENKNFSIEKFIQKKIGYKEITAMVSCGSNNLLYTGNIIGDITCISYLKSINSKANANNRKIIPSFTSFHTLNFLLVSLTKAQINSQKNSLQSKLENLAYRMQKHINKYHEDKQNQYEEMLQVYKIDSNCNMGTYRSCKDKIQKLQRHKIKARCNYEEEKNKCIKAYEVDLKKCIQAHNKFLCEMSGFMEKFKNEKEQLQRMYTSEQRKNRQQIERKEYEMLFQIKKAKYSSTLLEEDEDINTFQFTGHKQLNQSLSRQLSEERTKCFELNKKNGYLETAKKNMLSRKVQEQTLQCRIKQQANQLLDTHSQQYQHIQILSRDLKCTQELIHRIQNQVKNTPNNVISSDKEDSDLCSYKIWMKDKVQSEVNKLEELLRKIDQKFEKKSQEIVQVSMEKKATIQKIGNISKVHEVKKDAMKALKQKLCLLKSLNINAFKDSTAEKNDKVFVEEQPQQFDKEEIRDIVSKERINEKIIYFMNKNMKIHHRKMKNFGQNSSQMLSQYEKLMYENKCLVDKKKRMKEQVKKLKYTVEEERKMLQTMYSGCFSLRSSENKKQTPFERYVSHKSKKSQGSLTPFLVTAVSTPRMTYYNSLRTSRKI